MWVDARSVRIGWGERSETQRHRKNMVATLRFASLIPTYKLTSFQIIGLGPQPGSEKLHRPRGNQHLETAEIAAQYGWKRTSGYPRPQAGEGNECTDLNRKCSIIGLSAAQS